jgi:hypothetical protein
MHRREERRPTPTYSLDFAGFAAIERRDHQQITSYHGYTRNCTNMVNALNSVIREKRDSVQKTQIKPTNFIMFIVQFGSLLQWFNFEFQIFIPK